MGTSSPPSRPTSTPSVPGAPRRTEARHRLNLIEQITADATVSDYAGAVAGPRPSSRRERVIVSALVLALAGFLLAVGVSARVLNAPAVADQRQALQARIAATDARQQELTEQVQLLRRSAQDARAETLEQALGGQALAAELATVELVAGYVPVTGPGAVVTLRDAEVGQEGELDDLERVLDTDVQLAVNGLWAAGAEAIAVNGQRLSARSAIRSAAGAILVNYRPLTPPYRVEAIGPDDLAENFLAGQSAAELRAVSEQFGIGFDAEPAEEVRLPAAVSALPEQAVVIEQGQGEAG